MTMQFNLRQVRRRSAAKLLIAALFIFSAIPAPAQDIGHLGVEADPAPLVQARRPARRNIRSSNVSRPPVNIASQPKANGPLPKVDVADVRPVMNNPGPVTAPPGSSFEQVLAAAESASQTEQYELALDNYRRALKQRPDSAEAQLGLAETLFDMRRYDEAEREYNALLARNSKNGEAHRGLADIRYAQRRWRPSVESYQAAINAGLNDSAVYNNYANALFRTGTVENKERAIEYYRKAIQLEPSWPSAYAGLANALRGQRGPDGKLRLDEALAAATKGVELGPELALTRSILGRVYADMGRFDQAIREGQRAVDLTPKDPFVHLNLGGIYFVQKRYQDAERAYQKAIDLDPKWAFAYNALGQIYLNNLNRLADASLQFSKALLLEPNSPTLHINFGAARARSGDYNEAINRFKRAAELDPRSIAAYHNLGSVYIALRRYAEAAAAFQKATEIDPARSEYFVALGDTYRLMGKTREAEEAYSKARSQGAKFDDLGKDGKSGKKGSKKDNEEEKREKSEKKKKKKN